MAKLDLTKINYDRFVTRKYKDMEFTYKKWLTLDEQRAFIDAVLNGSINDGEYSEVLKLYSTRVAFLTFFTDIDLFVVDDLNSYIYSSLFDDIFEIVIEDIDACAYDAMINEINNAINKHDSPLAIAIREVMHELGDVNVANLITGLFENINNPEVLKIINGVTNT